MALGYLALVALHVVATSGMRGPIALPDEAGFLGNGRLLSGTGPTWPMGAAPPYPFLGGALYAPVHWLSGDPATRMRLVLLANALVLAAAFPLVHALLRRLLGAGPWTLIGGFAAALHPATFVLGAFGWAEPMAIAGVPLLLVAHARMLRPGRPLARAGFGATAAALPVVHARFVPVAVVAALVLVAHAAARRDQREIALTNLAVLVALGVALQAAQRLVLAVRWDHVYPSPATDVPLTDPGQWGSLARTLDSQVWYVAAGTMGTAVLGVLLLGRLLVGGGSAPRALAAPRRSTAGVALVVGAAVLAASVLQVRRPAGVDNLAYGRFIDSVVPVIAGVGVAGLVRGLIVRRDVWLAAAVVALSGLLLWPTWHPERYALYTSAPMAAIGRFVAADARAAIGTVTAWGLAGTAVILVVASDRWRAAHRSPHRRGSGMLVAVALVVAAPAAEGWLETRDTVADSRAAYDGWRAPAQIEALDSPSRIAYLGADRSLGAFFRYPWVLPRVAFDSSGTLQPGSADVVAAGVRWPRARELGARLAVVDDRYGQAIWVLPGPRQRDLDRKGLLLPAGFPARLPASARRVELSSPAVVDVGGRAVLRLLVRHDGRGSPLPTFAEGLPRGWVVLRATVHVGGPLGPIAGQATVPLPFLQPGQAASVDLDVTQARGALLRPGSIVLDAYQVGEPGAFVVSGRRSVRLLPG